MKTITMSDDFKRRLYPRLPEIYQEYGMSVNILDEIGIRETAQRMINGAANAGIVGYKNFYAVKACPLPPVLRILKEEGFGFDCSSPIEVQLALEAGAEPGDIIFTSNNTLDEEFELANDADALINLDDLSFLDSEYIQESAPETMFFRINPGPLRKDDSVIGIPEEAKYGIMVSEIAEAYTRAKSLGVKKFGMHTMICSNDLDYGNLVKTTQMLIDFVKNLRKETGIKIYAINIGGGIGIPYKLDDKPFELEKLYREIAKIQAQYRAEFGDEIKIYTECGRFVTGPHGVFANKAINRKMTYQEHIGIPIAMPGLMRPAMYGAYHHIEIVDQFGRLIDPEIAECRVVNIVGPICENCDRLATRRPLPIISIGRIEGDWIMTHCTGAHATAMGFNYNGRTRPGTLLLKADGSLVWAEMPETIDDLLRRTRGL